IFVINKVRYQPNQN
ncbi:TPA: ErmCL family antibiotic resistance leader peptide, partial [Enterococcus faecium]|nr:ErmCL family antibiotic resistance leader peptide [Enterococcus faecium]HDC9217114.1 erythromycin resistance leader peptide [Staphylococcus aureus]HAR1964922.1 ErmCL family antibiotic resistance leader peptide [Enterococcus faecium]HBA2012939.1 ErmCL family antibiotic resistance leader peptide [Enterococcus faecium]HCR2417967.1 erythromycin resistance leader peptide [Enterococcus faecium]